MAGGINEVDQEFVYGGFVGRCLSSGDAEVERDGTRLHGDTSGLLIGSRI